MLTLVGDLARRATTLNPHLEDYVLEQTPGIVTIDELDLHLHPKWQRHVIRDLTKTFPSIQFVATTHSPQLIGEAQPNEVILLGQEESSNPAQSFGMDSNWILNHVMGADELDHDIKKEKEEVATLIADQKLDAAQTKLNKLRSKIGDHPDLVKYSARIERFSKNIR
jgi:predicted ATP-binding protein involved in virulence